MLDTQDIVVSASDLALGPVGIIFEGYDVGSDNIMREAVDKTCTVSQEIIDLISSLHGGTKSYVEAYASVEVIKSVWVEDVRTFAESLGVSIVSTL